MFPFTVRYYSVFLIILIIISMISCAPKVTDTNIDSGHSDSDSAKVALDTKIDDRSSSDYEPYPVFKASEILDPKLLKSYYHEVLEVVTNDCIWNSYTIKSDFGEYDAVNTNMLKTRVNEINATARLKETSGG